jgi:Peptidase_C39 like family
MSTRHPAARGLTPPTLLTHLTLKVLRAGWFKQQAIDSQMLSPDQKVAVGPGDSYIARSVEPMGKHLKVTLEQPLQGYSIWYVFNELAAIYNGTRLLYPLTVKWTVPYFNQLANAANPYGTCNVSSLAMALAYSGAAQKSADRFPDELNDYCVSQALDRHDPQALAQIARDYGMVDTFTTQATISQVKEWLVQGNVAVVHGYFTSEGHIICLIGFDETGFWVNDPYGEWFPGGYDRNDDVNFTKGKGLHYSYEMIQQTCSTDDFWVHFIEKL